MATDARRLPAAGTTTYLKLTTVSVIWGGTFVAGRFLSHDIPPLFSATIRFLTASATLLSFLVVTRTPFKRVSRRQLAHLAVLGLFGIFAYNVCFFYGLKATTASRASLIVALNPAMMALVSFAVFKERLSIGRNVGIALCLVGAGTVIVSRDLNALVGAAGAWQGDLLIFGCVVSWVIYSVFSKSLSNTIGPLHTVTYSVLLGALMLLAATAALGQLSLSAVRGFSVPNALGILYLGVVGSAIAYIWYYDGIRKIGVTRSGVFIALNPLSAVLLGALILGEQLSLWVCVGGVLIVGGILLCNWRPAAPVPVRVEAAAGAASRSIHDDMIHVHQPQPTTD